ncbi:MAG: phosphoadenylyl-sulfate reductase [Chlorobi bacterium]|nr:phosphoadenylyl-sulfate reductase [Chlorobiota bacterium]
MVNENTIRRWNGEFSHKSPDEILRFFIDHFKDRIALSTSLGLEDQVLTEMAVRINRNIKIFTLDTGRLFSETYDLLDRTINKYGIRIQVYFPDASEVEKMVYERGINLFYESIENRKLCCAVRKLKPLSRALNGLDAWITGLRKEQSESRNNLKVVEWDKNNGLVKINPLLYWSEEEVRDYIDAHNIPYNPLHDKGYPSIGCHPCTRAVEPGEEIRAGRWWWENAEAKECGLHKR